MPVSYMGKGEIWDIGDHKFALVKGYFLFLKLSYDHVCNKYQVNILNKDINKRKEKETFIQCLAVWMSGSSPMENNLKGSQ